MGISLLQAISVLPLCAWLQGPSEGTCTAYMAHCHGINPLWHALCVLLAQGFSCFGTGPLCLRRVWVTPKYSREIQLCDKIVKMEQGFQGTSILLFSMKASLGGFGSLVKRGCNSVDKGLA